MEPLILTSSSQGVGRLTFNRPAQRNAMSVEMLSLLQQHLVAMEADPEIRCVVLTGAGQHFTGGGDVAAWSRLRSLCAEERSADFRRRLLAMKPLVLLLDRFSKPLIAAVRGVAAGAGLSFVAAADFVIADETARFIFANVRIALAPDMGQSYFVSRAVGVRTAQRLSLLGEQLDAKRAEQIGLVSELVSARDFSAALETLTEKLSSLPVTSLRETKRVFQQSGSSELSQRFDMEVDAVSTASSTDDFLEAVSAFEERRKATFGR